MTTNEFINRALGVHGDRYDYSKVNYITCDTKVCIICPKHGEFWQTPTAHLNCKCPCPLCRGKVHNTESFIKKAREVHGDKYDYSKVDWKNSKTIITIICPKHGEFLQEANAHLLGRGCPYCTGNKFCFSDYIEKANKVWNNKYDYSKFEWNGTNKKVCIICPEHGEFWLLPNNHLSGECGCLECRGKSKDFKKINSLEDLIEQSENKFGKKFDFSKAIYNGSREKIRIICPEHGEFLSLPYNFIKTKFGCPKCGLSHEGKRLIYTNEEFIKVCLKTHVIKYDYSKINYTGSLKTITIICPIHGEFLMLACSFMRGGNCPLCVIDSYRLGTKEFIRRAQDIHGDYYDYSKVLYKNCETPVTIICPKHGEFQLLPSNHLRGCNCSKCANENLILSKGEELVASILDKYNVKYQRLYEIVSKYLARNSNIIRVDFALRRNNHIYIIEYNGKLHYEYVPFFFPTEEDFKKQLRRDELLRHLCAVNSDKVTLLEIKYNQSEEQILNVLNKALKLF